MVENIALDTSHLKCINCQKDASFQILTNALKCTHCSHSFPINKNIIDFLYRPSPDTVKELRGMAVENGYQPDDLDNFKIKENPDLKTYDDLAKKTANEHNQYYQQTQMNFEQAFKLVQKKVPIMQAHVLEIGAQYDYHFLRHFQAKGATCYSLNIHYNYSNLKDFHDWPIKVIADMNELPFASSSLDVVLISATSHHSNTPHLLVQEINRVLRPGGQCLMINDPTDGLLKKLGGKYTAVRHDHINENEYSIWHYNKLFRQSQLKATHLFSDYYDQKLKNAVIHPETRFSGLARLIVRFWKINAFRNLAKRRLLWFAQAVFGFPMNVILEKRK